MNKDQTDTTINILDPDSTSVDEDPITQDKQQRAEVKCGNFRNMLFRYFLFFFIGQFLFTFQYDGKYHRFWVPFGFLHFATEFEISSYLLLNSLKKARIASMTFYFFLIIESILNLFLYDLRIAFAVQYIISDLSAMIIPLFIMYRNPSFAMFRMCAILLLHFIGTTTGVCMRLVVWYIDGDYESASNWLALGITSYLQLYLARDILKGNYIIDNKPKLLLWEQIGLVVFILILMIAFYTTAFLRTTESKDIDDIRWGTPGQVSLLNNVAVFTSSVAFVFTIYWFMGWENRMVKKN